MKKYFCENCGTQFCEDEIDTINEDGRLTECCPQCREYGYFREMEKCEKCGHYSPELEDGFCQDCIRDTILWFNGLIEDNFTEQQKEILLFFGYIGEPAL